MKIMVSAQGPDLQSQVSPRFGRGAYFLAIDTDTLDFTVLDNSSAVDSKQGAGVQAAQKVAASGVSALLTGHCGPKAHQVLTAAGITIYNNVEGTVTDAVARFNAGDFTCIAVPDVEGHWQ